MQLGFVGLGKMGGNMVHRIHRDSDHTVVSFDFSEDAVKKTEEYGATGASSLEDMISKLEAPRSVWIMVPAGDPTQETIDALTDLLEEGDAIIDGGNSRWTDDKVRAEALAEKGIEYADVGTSGGVWGLEVGYCMMVGGTDEAVGRLSPILDVLAPPETKEHGPGWQHFGGPGAGHYVKMVHNGIEYGLMQAYAEGFDLFDHSEYDLDKAKIAHVWMQGSVIRSWLCELAADAFEQDGNDLGDLDAYTEDSGEGRWTIQDATEKDVPTPVMTAALYARFYTRGNGDFTGRMLSALRNQFGGHSVRTKAERATDPRRRLMATEPGHAEHGHHDENPLADGLERQPVHPTTLTIFGATGDLSKRKLLPALYNLAHEGALPERFNLIGSSRSDLSADDFREMATESINEFSRREPDQKVLEGLLSDVRYVSGPFDEDDVYEQLKTAAAEFDEQAGIQFNRVFYLSTAPSFFPVIVAQLGKHDLEHHEDADVRVVIEKPIGRNLQEAKDLNRAVLDVLDEDQAFRIDHYLGKETVQNMLAFRFANGLFEPIWNRNYVDNVQITSAEDIGIGSRAGYYDTSGALRDLVQNHMLQLLCLLCMEPPVNFYADEVRDEKVKVLHAIHPPTPEQVKDMAVRAQYTAGTAAGEDAKGYKDEDDVPDDSVTETYAALRLEVDNWRWAGVPIYLRTGKRLARKVTEIAVTLKPVPHLAFQDGGSVGVQPNQIVMTLQPNEGVSISLGAKIPGSTMRIRPVNMEFLYGTAFMSQSPEAYERLIMDAMRGEATLFTRDDEVEAQWAICDPILEAWEADDTPLYEYEAGTSGPDEVDQLLLRDSEHWRTI